MTDFGKEIGLTQQAAGNRPAEIEEEEQFTELASSEFLMQQVRSLIDAGGQETLDTLPDGIHSGLAKAGAKGSFFYFQGRPSDGGKLHFWKNYALKDIREFQQSGDLKLLIGNVEDLRKAAGIEEPMKDVPGKTQRLTRGDLRLICFDFLTAG